MTKTMRVRDRLQQRYKLNVLRIYLDYTMNDRTVAIFDLTVAGSETAAILTTSMNELGLPDSLDPDATENADLDDSVFRIPVHILSSLKSILDRSEPHGAPLWIRLSVPLGLLPAVPWEKLLQPHLGIPILRLPHQQICPRAPRRGIDLVICFSAPIYVPEFQERISLFIEQVPPNLSRATNFHLFADRNMVPALREVEREYGDRLRIRVYSPPPDIFNICPPVQNPWLSWIRTEMGQTSADVVHFLCHSYRVCDEGALAVGSSPRRPPDDRSAVILRSSELVEFLNQVGAWCVIFSSTPNDRSGAGMRMLQNTIARLRPGPIVVHDTKDPDSRSALSETYRFLFTPPSPPPDSPAISLYCHPLWIPGNDEDEASRHQLTWYTLDERLPDNAVTDSPPTWLASSQRILESSAEELAEAEKVDPHNGRKRARELVLNAIAAYAKDILPKKEPQDDVGDTT